MNKPNQNQAGERTQELDEYYENLDRIVDDVVAAHNRSGCPHHYRCVFCGESSSEEEMIIDILKSAIAEVKRALEMKPTQDQPSAGEQPQPRKVSGPYGIKEGDCVIHEDRHGQSEGVADSDAILSGNRLKVNFSSGPRMGECRWVPLQEVIRARS